LRARGIKRHTSQDVQLLDSVPAETGEQDFGAATQGQVTH